MILSVHAIFGAAVASVVPAHPVGAFCLGFASHFILDAIPHVDYKLISVDYNHKTKVRTIDIIANKIKLIRDVILASLDALVGLSLSFLFFFNPYYPWIFFIGALGALLPDIIVFSYLLLKHKMLGHFFNFHSYFDSPLNLKLKEKIGQITGVSLQFITLIILLIILLWVKRFL